jgi:hypothetical protein
MEQHEHKHIRYTIYMSNRHWWGGRVKLALLGTHSSQQGSELLIFQEDGSFWSINYAHVYRMVAEPLQEQPHTH